MKRENLVRSPGGGKFQSLDINKGEDIFPLVDISTRGKRIKRIIFPLVDTSTRGKRILLNLFPLVDTPTRGKRIYSFLFPLVGIFFS